MKETMVATNLSTERLKKFLALGLEAARLGDVGFRDEDDIILLADGFISIAKVEQTPSALNIRQQIGRLAPGLHQLWEVTEWRPTPSTHRDDSPDVNDKLVGRYASDEEAARRAVLWLVEESICNAIATESMAEACA